MKKLMVMIGAVATAFGLFATEPIIDKQFSFESGETGVGEKYDAESAGWTWTGDLLTLGAYAGDNYGYQGDGNSRREEFTDQASYLKLETTKTETLVYEFDSEAAATDKFVDQLVQFTGFEEPPTVTGAKIAVWMSEFVTSEENVEPETTETNLWVTCGELGLSAKLANPNGDLWEIGKWYRLTIKSVGQIAEDGTVGFNIYIDGKQVQTAEGEVTAFTAKSLSDADSAAMIAGKLFPAISAGAIASVGYNGIGAIDDITIDDQGPEFARKIPFTVAEPTGLTISSIVDAAGNTVSPTEGVLSGTQVIVTYGAAEGWKLLPGSATTAKETITAAGVTIEPGEGIKFEEVVATVENDETTTDYAASELYALVTEGLVDGDVLTFLADATITDGDEIEPTTLYSFTANSTITVAVAENVTTWTVAIAGESAWASDYVGTTATFNKVYTLPDENSTLELAGDIDGVLTAPIVDASAAIEVSGTLKADELTIDSFITLVGSGKVLSKDGKLKDSFEADGEIEVTGPDAGEYYTYAISGSFEVTVQLDAANVVIESIVVDGETIDSEEYGDGKFDVKFDVKNKITVTYAPAADYKWAEAGEDGIREVTAADTIEAPTVVQKEYVAQIGDDGAKYESLAEAFAVAKNDETINVLADCTIAERIDIDGAKNITLDATGKTVTMTAKYPLVMGGADTELKTGKLTIVGGTFVQDVEDGIPVWARRGLIDIKGGTFNSLQKNAQVVYSSYPGAVVTIEGGTFTMVDGGDVLNVAQTLDPPATEADIVVKGGSFSKDPAEGDDYYKGTFVAEGYRSTKSGDVWTVAAIPTHEYYANIVLDGEVKGTAQPGDGDHVYAEGETVPVSNNAFLTDAQKTALGLDGVYYVSKMEAGALVAEFECTDGATITAKPDATLSVTLTGTTLTMSVVVGENECLGTIYLSKYEAEPDFPLDPTDDKLDENGKKAVETAKTVFGDGLAAYVAAVYGTEGGIPASKLNATSEELIKIAKEYNLQIMEAGKVAIEITESATANAFEFQIKDAGTAVSLAAVESKILSMVEFTSDLGDSTKPFATATTTDVEVAIKEDNKTATATFKKATAAGFMRVNLKVE